MKPAFLKCNTGPGMAANERLVTFAGFPWAKPGSVETALFCDVSELVFDGLDYWLPVDLVDSGPHFALIYVRQPVCVSKNYTVNSADLRDGVFGTTTMCELV